MQNNKVNGLNSKDVFNQSEKVAVVNDNPPVKKKRSVNSLSHKEYLKITDFMRNKEEQIREAPFTKEGIVKFISDGVGFQVSLYTILDAAEATGVKWKTVKKERSDANKDRRLSTHCAVRNLACAVAILYKQLGVEPTPGLRTVYKRFCEEQGYKPIEEIEVK